MAEPDLYVGKEPCTFDFRGSPVFIGPGTVVRAGHPLMKGREGLFEPLTVHFDHRAPAEDPNELEQLRTQAEQAGITVDKRWGPDRLRQEIAKSTH